MPQSIIQSKFFLIVVCAFISAVLQIFQLDFIYLKSKIWFEAWRLWTGHWVHVGWIHYLLNMLAFACLPYIFPQIKNKTYFCLLMIIAPLLSLTFYFIYPEIQAYAGLSGVLHGLYIFAAIIYFDQKNERKFALLVIVLVVIKIAWEQKFGQLGTAKLIGSPVLVQAHLWGVIWASIIAVSYLFYKHKQLKMNG